MTESTDPINMPTINLHGTLVQYHDTGILLLGDAGCGKSELALMLIERGAQLVADDQIIITRINNTIHASCPEAIRGLLHIRGLGILQMPHLDSTIVHCVVQSTHEEEILPASENRHTLLGVDLPCYGLCFKHPAAIAKITVLTGHGTARLVSVN